jgi:hypothetical protein
MSDGLVRVESRFSVSVTIDRLAAAAAEAGGARGLALAAAGLDRTALQLLRGR